MKVIAVDNYDRDNVSDLLIRDNLTKPEAQALADKLNDEQGERGDWYYRVVSDETPLHKFEP